MKIITIQYLTAMLFEVVVDADDGTMSAEDILMCCHQLGYSMLMQMAQKVIVDLAKAVSSQDCCAVHRAFCNPSTLPNFDFNYPVPSGQLNWLK